MGTSHSFPYLDYRDDNIPTRAPTHLASVQRYPNACSRLKQRTQITALPQSPRDKAERLEIAQKHTSHRLSLP